MRSIRCFPKGPFFARRPIASALQNIQPRCTATNYSTSSTSQSNPWEFYSALRFRQRRHTVDPRNECHRRATTHRRFLHPIPASNHSKTATTMLSSSESDPYNEYRQTGEISAHILGELQLETLHTQRRIDQELYEELLEEVQSAWGQQQHATSVAPAEEGPTGMWLYRFTIEETTGKRIYQRTWKDDSEVTTQVVLELEPSDEVLAMSVTVDESCIACLVEGAHSGRREIRLRHIDTDRQNTLQYMLDHEDNCTVVGLEWGPVQPEGDHSIYLVGADEQGRPNRIFVSLVNPAVLHVTKPELLIQSNEPSEIVDVQRTKGCHYVAIQAMTKTSNEIYLSSGATSIDLVLPRHEGIQYHLDIGEQDDLAILLSENGGEYKLIETTLSSLPMRHEELRLGSQRPAESFQGQVITDMDLFRDHLVLYENSTPTGYPQITIRRRGSSETSHSVTIPLAANDTACTTISPVGNTYFGATSLRCMVENPFFPPSIHELDFLTSEISPIHPPFEPSISFKQERVFVPSKDGSEVPLSLIYRENQDPPSWSSWFASSENSRPVVLIGYGAYGESVNMGYDPTLLPLLQRGYVLAFAHTRGGGELGKAWYHAGRKDNKPNAIDDFEVCAEYLKGRWAGPLTAKGFSAAGVIIGATVNRQPELFDSVVLTNAFVDVHATMTNPNLFLTAHEWDEYGNPLEDPDMDATIRSYCPISNVATTTDNYPHCLLIGTLNDQNAPIWNAAIFAKKIRDRMKDKDGIFLHMEETGGHHLGAQRLQVAALELTFILQCEKSPLLRSIANK